jgi:hypothetical protein
MLRTISSAVIQRRPSLIQRRPFMLACACVIARRSSRSRAALRSFSAATLLARAIERSA